MKTSLNTTWPAGSVAPPQLTRLMLMWLEAKELGNNVTAGLIEDCAVDEDERRMRLGIPSMYD